MRYTHSQILLHKSRDDYFKYTRIFTKLQIKSQILKKHYIHKKNPPGLTLICIRTVILDLFHDFNTVVLSIQISLFLVYGDIELCGPQVSVDIPPQNTSLHRKISHFFFEMGRAFPKIWKGQQGIPRGFWKCHVNHQWSKGPLAKSVPASQPTSLGSAASWGCLAVFKKKTMI